MLGTLGERVINIHNEIRNGCPELGRVAVAIYEPETDILHTFVDSTNGESPLVRYEARLSDVPSLLNLAHTGECRVIDDFSVIAKSGSVHSRRLIEAGYRSSFTIPLFSQETLIGFIFFDSKEEGVFKKPLQIHLGLYARLMAAFISNDINPLRALRGAIKTAREFSKHRDEETAAHLSRMSHYVRLIAAELTDSSSMSDEIVEYLFQFAPLHDIGKIAISDCILLKPMALSSSERGRMRHHVAKGVEMIDVLVREFGLGSLKQIGMLRNVIAHHHEHFDGSGYPFGLAGAGISMEGRIVCVADVFDALTSARPYKPAWPLQEAMDYMLGHSGTEFDPDCVAVLERFQSRIKEIHDRFKDDMFH